MYKVKCMYWRKQETVFIVMTESFDNGFHGNIIKPLDKHHLGMTISLSSL